MAWRLSLPTLCCPEWAWTTSKPTLCSLELVWKALTAYWQTTEQGLSHIVESLLGRLPHLWRAEGGCAVWTSLIAAEC